MIPASEALERLRVGNTRFTAGKSMADRERLGEARRLALADAQAPIAIILGCSDARVPAEIVFDQGLGDLFVIRVAGNIAAPSQIGSVEFAATQLGTRLVVVLGHSNCGAIAATLDAISRSTNECSPALSSIVDRIRPVVEPLTSESRDDLMRLAVRANVLASIERLRTESSVLTGLIDQEELMMVGAEYSLETGCVEFYT